MPTYEYQCSACGRRVEVVQRFVDDPLTTCEECGGALRRIFHPVGVVLKGSGFYATDNRSGKSLRPGEKGEKGSERSSEKSERSSEKGERSSEKSSEKSSETSIEKSAAKKDTGSASSAPKPKPESS